MALPLPRTLSPTKLSTFTDCALAFRFIAIDGLREPPTIHTVKGSFVHLALQVLIGDTPPEERGLPAALDAMETAWRTFRDNPELLSLDLPAAEVVALREEAGRLVRSYLEMEDPRRVRAVGVELRMSAGLAGARLTGIVDRLDVTEAGEWVIVDYKTGKTPPPRNEQERFAAMHFYALLCERMLGRRPVELRLLYLRDQVVLTMAATEQSARGCLRRTEALWHAIERACEAEDFRPRPSPKCRWCAFTAYCPSYGGDPERAVVELRAPALR